MGALDIGIVGPALPSIKMPFGINERLLSWIFTIYILFFMIGTPLMAKLSDKYGRKTLYILDVLLFAIGSAITVSSTSFDTLLIGLAIQGLVLVVFSLWPALSLGTHSHREKRWSIRINRISLGIFWSFRANSWGFTPKLWLAVAIYHKPQKKTRYFYHIIWSNFVHRVCIFLKLLKE